MRMWHRDDGYYSITVHCTVYLNLKITDNETRTWTRTLRQECCVANRWPSKVVSYPLQYSPRHLYCLCSQSTEVKYPYIRNRIVFLSLWGLIRPPQEGEASRIWSRDDCLPEGRAATTMRGIREAMKIYLEREERSCSLYLKYGELLPKSNSPYNWGSGLRYTWEGGTLTTTVYLEYGEGQRY